MNQSIIVSSSGSNPNNNDTHKLRITSDMDDVTHYELYVNDIGNADSMDDIIMSMGVDYGDRLKKLDIYISSFGGSVSVTNKLITHIRTNFSPENITTHAYSVAVSSGFMLFLIGSKRVSTPDSELMFHLTKSNISDNLTNVLNDTIFSIYRSKRNIKNNLLDKGYITKKEYKKMMSGEDIYFTAKALCKRGITTHMNVDGIIYEAKVYLSMIGKSDDSISHEVGEVMKRVTSKA